MEKCEGCQREVEKLYNIGPTERVCLRCRRKLRRKLRKASIGKR